VVVSVAKEENNPTIIGLTQQLDPELWTWSANDPNGVALLHQGAHAILDYLVQRLESGGCEVIEAYGINHDKDEREVWSDVHQALVTEAKPLHIHAIIKFKNRAKSAPIARLAGLLGVEAQYVEKPGRGGHAYDNMLSYLTHAKYADKYQYAPSEVATVRGPDYLGIDAQRRDTWVKGRAHIVKKRAAENVEDLVARVLAGELSMEQILLTDDLYEIYSRHMRVIDEAFVAFGKRRAMRAAVDLKAGKFETQIVFFTGANGSGKSKTAEWFADEIVARAARHGLRWEVHEAAARNSMDDYGGEEILMMDEARANAMGAADWLLLMNPEKASPASARYKNKGKVAPRLIVITNTTHPMEYFYYVREKGDIDEAMGQFIRRLSLLVTVVAENLGTPDEMRRYFVQTVKSVAPYEHKLMTREGEARFEVDRGFTDRIEYTLEGTKAALALDFASRSRDVPFAQGDDWPALEALVAEETTTHEVLARLEPPERDDLDPWDIPMGEVPTYVG
jgi:hypothetical protein